MKKVLLVGCGKIGATILDLLHGSGDFRVTVGDCLENAAGRIVHSGVEMRHLDVRDARALDASLAGHDAVICAGPHDVTLEVIAAAARGRIAYFDLTEDVRSADGAKVAASKSESLFVPQCGLAPGIVSIAAAHLARRFDRLDKVHLRVGALPQFPTNALKYNLTWSTDGLINEYLNRCRVVAEGKQLEAAPLEGLEEFLLDGVSYEAFNTSGGVGTLCDTLGDRAREINYKTVRYPGHRAIMKLLIDDLRLGGRRDLLKDILEQAVPLTNQDVVLIFVSVTGEINGRFVQSSYVKKVYGQAFHGVERSAIQITTASALCAVVDLWREGQLPAKGFVRQEDIPFEAVTANRFGKIFAGGSPQSGMLAA
ncbi:MAG: saccharopine dehydrogenase family protein [Rhodospirillaceae bacterium]